MEVDLSGEWGGRVWITTNRVEMQGLQTSLAMTNLPTPALP